MCPVFQKPFVLAIPIPEGSNPSPFLSFGSDSRELSDQNQKFLGCSCLRILSQPVGSLTNDMDQTTLNPGLWPNLVNRLQKASLAVADHHRRLHARPHEIHEKLKP